MSAVPSLPPPEPGSFPSRGEALARLRSDLVRKFPGAVALAPSPGSSAADARQYDARLRDPHAALRREPFLWVEVVSGQGGVAWLAAWTLLRLAEDPLHRPALWIDTHCTLTPGDLLDLEGRVVVVRPDDAHEAHVAADIALRAGSFSLIALEMHRALHPKPLARLARLARAARDGSAPGTVAAQQAATSPTSVGESPAAAHTPLVLWGEPPPFVAPPSGIPRTPFGEAVSALLGDPRVVLPVADETRSEREQGEQETSASDALPFRAPHTTDRLRPLDRAADRRPSPPPPRVAGRNMDAVDALARDARAREQREHRERERDDDAPFPFTRRSREAAPR